MFAVFILNRISRFPSRRPDFLDSCRANTLLAELDDEEDLPEPDDDDDENEDDNQEDQEYEEVLVMQLCYFCIVFPWRASAGCGRARHLSPSCRRRRSTRPKEVAGGLGTMTLS